MIMDYQPMYTLLFNTITDALREMEKQIEAGLGELEGML